MKNKVLLGMSGGVDSTASALLLIKQGYEVVGATYRLTDDENYNLSINDAKKACDKIGIKHIVVDYRNEFEKTVINNFTSEYYEGHTPNPCVVCNKNIKYTRFLETADELNIEYVATGQYAKLINKNGRYYIQKPKDRKKDQTYFLYTLKEKFLNRVIFPMGDIDSKDTTRNIVKEAGIEIYSKKDSQEICFIKNCEYKEFVINKTGIEPRTGNFIDKNNNILGEHKGIINYTIGQRKGLGITFGKPVFVIDINSIDNTVMLGDEKDLFSSELNIYDYTFINEEYDVSTIKLNAKIRYAAEEQPATLTKFNGFIHVLFDDPVRAITKGQSVVFYDNDILVGGGIIN